MSQTPTYAKLIREAMRNYGDKGMTRRDMQRALNYSYEHIRKVVDGFPVMSEKFNEDVCRLLKLNPKEMWEIALREKINRSGNGPRLFNMTIPDPRLKNIWDHLDTDARERYLKIGEGMAEALAVERKESDDPEIIREQINKLMVKLTKGSSERAEERHRSAEPARRQMRARV